MNKKKAPEPKPGKKITYRGTAAWHKHLRIEAAKRGMTTQDLLDEAVRWYLLLPDKEREDALLRYVIEEIQKLAERWRGDPEMISRTEGFLKLKEGTLAQLPPPYGPVKEN